MKTITLACLFLALGLVLESRATPIPIEGTWYETSGPSEALTVQFTAPTGGVTTGNFSGYVQVSVSGYGWSMGTALNDAFYLFTGPETPAHNPYHHQLTFGVEPLIANDPSQDAKYFIVFDLDDYIEVLARPYVPEYNPEHVYKFALDTGTTIPRQLRFGVSDGAFGDNGGSFSVQVSQLAPVPEPATMLLVATGLIGIAGSTARKLKRRLRGGLA